MSRKSPKTNKPPEQYINNFLEQHPQVTSLRIRVLLSEYGREDEDLARSRAYQTPGRLPALLYCINPYCYDGTLNLRAHIDTAVTQQQTHVQHGFLCPGKEGAPRSGLGHRDCLHSCNLELWVTYSDAAAPDQSAAR